MSKKYYGLQVHTLTFLKVDESGESIDGKEYEYTGDHSSFCEGIEDEYLEEVKKTELTHTNLKEKYASLEPDLNDEEIEEEARLKDGDDEVSWSK